jgi:hypothetical protein
MEINRSDIVIELRLRDDDHVRSKLLLKAFDNLETALYASDRRDVGLAASELNIPTFVRDATLERLRQYNRCFPPRQLNRYASILELDY